MRNILFMSRVWLWLIAAIVVTAYVPAAFAKDAPADKSKEKAGTESLFDGKTLGKWVSTNFGGEGEVRVEDGAITLDAGASLTGINYTGPVLKTNYEISLDAQRIQGTDFFCGLTVPVGDSYASLIVGGWGGSLCGISSIDDKDAARNDTPRSAITKRLIISVESSSIETFSSSSTGSSQAFRRARVVPVFGNRTASPSRSLARTLFWPASRWRGGTNNLISSEWMLTTCNFFSCTGN